MVINSIKLTVLVVFRAQHGLMASNNLFLFASIHLYSIRLFTNMFGVFWIFLELVEAVDARIART